MNFLKIVLQKLDDQSLGLLGAVLGENEEKVRDGVKSVVPKVLEAMVSVSQAKEGRDMLWRELRDTDASVANNFSQQLYYKDSQSLVETGRDQLDGLMGVEASRLVQSVSREADLGSTTAKRLVGAVTPLVFASMADHQQSKKLTEQELADVIAAQSGHLSDWQRQDLGFFPANAASEHDRSPLFDAQTSDNTSQNFVAASNNNSSGFQQSDGSQTNRGNEDASIATASASASLGMDHFRDSENDKADESGKTFDQRSEERRQRESIAINPADAASSIDADSSDSNSVNPNDTDATGSSKSGIAGAIAAAGVGAAGVTAAAMNTTAKDSSTNGSPENVGVKNDGVANTYDSNNAVSGFAANTLTSDNDATAESSDKRLWTPESAKRDQDGTLKYSSAGNSTLRNDSSATATGGKQSGGWFHWLWWPVLFFGSLLAASFFVDLDEVKQHLTSLNGDQAATVQSDDEADASDSTETSPTTNDATPSDENTEEVNTEEVNTEEVNTEEVNTEEVNTEEGIADQDGSEIQASSTEADANDSDTSDSDTSDSDADSEDADSEDASDEAASDEDADPNETSDESTPDLAAADSNEDAATDSESQNLNSDQPNADNADQDEETKTETDSDAAESSQDDSSSPEGNAADQSTTSESGGNADASADAEGSSVVDDDMELLDADEQVEEILSAIELQLNGVDSKAKANAAKQKLTQQLAGLEDVLSNRQQWKDEIGILVDFQLDEGKKMLSKKKKELFKTKAVKNSLADLFQKFNQLMTPAAAEQ